MEPTTQTSPRVVSPKFMGRMVGVGYLVLRLAGFDMFYVFGKLVVREDAADTGTNIQEHQPAMRSYRDPF